MMSEKIGYDFDRALSARARSEKTPQAFPKKVARGPYDAEICCICNEKVSDRAQSPLWLLGNNPWPVVYDADDIARACDVCNALEVVPARLKSYFSSRDHLSGRPK